MNDSKVIRNFYGAFTIKNGEAMATCYHPNATFSDPIFPRLSSESAKNMWCMLCQNGRDLEITYRIESSANNLAVVNWEARYTFSKTSRKVHNRVSSILEIRDGKIFKHMDDFGFWRWSKQALGPLGWILGWFALIKDKIRDGAAKSLSQFTQHRDNHGPRPGIKLGKRL